MINIRKYNTFEIGIEKPMSCTIFILLGYYEISLKSKWFKKLPKFYMYYNETEKFNRGVY